MFQLSVIVVLVASMFVGRTSPLMRNEERETKVVATSLNIANVTHVSTETSSNSKSKTIDLPLKATLVKKDLDLKTMNESHNSASMNLTEFTNVSTPINENNNRDKEKQKCNSTTEQADMLRCNVTPRDSEDDESLNTTEPATRDNATTANNKIKSSTESQVPEVRPHEEEENGTDVVIDVNKVQITNHVPYDIVPADNRTVEQTNSSDVSSTDLKHGETNETWPLAVRKAATNVNSENMAGVAKSVNRKHMPSGIIALVTAISFAVAIALVYIGMIVWRRYIEYRYGHRELLVNELEFDTNDLRHFEL